MPTDFGIAGSRNYKADLTAVDAGKARSLLLAVKTQITGTNGTKSGVLKLVNLQGGGNIAFERKGIMTRMFQRDGAAMRTTAETLKDLFAKAGFSPEIRQELSDYLDRRENRAGTKTISELITKGFTGIRAASADDPKEALRMVGVVQTESLAETGMGGGRGQLAAADRVGQKCLIKLNKQFPELKLDGVNARGEPRLDRGRAAGSAYLENRVPGIVRPEIYVLVEQRADGGLTSHAVSGDKHFKRWAADRLARNPGSSLVCAGVVMARAKGVEMMNANDKEKPAVVATVSPEVLAGAALDGLATLKKMSAGGFVHGDLKSPNMFIDSKTRTLQFIDVDDISKMRKGQNGVAIPGFTSGFSHPNAMRGAVGFEQDLMGLGVSILHTALTNRGHSNDAENFKAGLYDYNKAFKELAKAGNADASDPGFMKLRAIIEGAVPADASPVEILALNWINAALDQSAPMSVRYDPEGNGTHLLDSVDPSRNPAVATRIDRRTGAVAAPQPRAPLTGMAAMFQPRQEPQAPARPAQQPAPAAPQVQPARPAQRGLGAAAEQALDALAVAMDDALPSAAVNVVYPAVEAWTKGIEGMAALAEAAAEGRSPDALAARIREILTDRINLEHLRFAVGADPALAALPAESRTTLEQQLNRRAVFQDAVVMNSAGLATRIEAIRTRMKF